MNSIEKFKKQNKYRIMATILALLFFIPSMVIKYNQEAFTGMPVTPMALALILQITGLIFIGLVYINTKCPACSKYAGNGWSITKCRNCGEKLS